MKFKAGDEVKVIARIHGHHFNIGEIVKIIRVKNGFYVCMSSKKDIWGLNDDEFVEVKFTKQDLKHGDKCTLKNGQVVFVDKSSTYGFDSIDEQLRFFNDNASIVKVERPVKYETVFERKEEILDKTEKEYLANVIRPFRHKIKTIEKTTEIVDSSLCYLKILLENNDMANLPNFKKISMYKGMELNKKYTLKELGL